MRRRAQNSNKQFLYGTAAMGLAVLITVFIFVSLSLDKLKEKANGQPAETHYRIRLADGFLGDSAVIYVADSLLWSGSVSPTDTPTIRFTRFSDDRSIIISRTVNSPVFFFPLPEKNSSLVFREKGDSICMTINE